MLQQNPIVMNIYSFTLLLNKALLNNALKDIMSWFAGGVVV